MRHVVVGAGGFLGSHLMAALPDAEGFDLPDWDVRDRSHCNSMPLTGATVWHLAADNSATRVFYDDPGRVLDVQIRGTMNMLDACLDQGAHTFVLFSSSEVFQGAPVPTPETVPLVVPDIRNPRFSYGGAKIAAELMTQWSALPRCLTLRPFNCYGPGQRPGHVVADVVSQRIAGSHVSHAGDAFAVRSFCYVDDFVAAALTIELHHRGDAQVREVYHVGTEEPIRIAELANEIGVLCGGGGTRTAPTNGPVGETKERCPDTTKLRALGWAPKVSLREGLAKTIAWHREQKAEAKL